MKHQKYYTKETYSGMATITGLLAGAILLCNRLIVPLRIGCQIFLILLYAASCCACHRIFDHLKRNHSGSPTRSLISKSVLPVLSLVLIHGSILLLAIIPILPCIFKSLAAFLGNVLWLRLRLNLLLEGVENN